MLIGRIRNSNAVLKAPEGMDNCSDLAIRADRYSDGTQGMVSAWLPTPDELARLNAGHAVHLTVFGVSHPPVSLQVAED